MEEKRRIEVAEAITANWESTRAQTISQSQVVKFSQNPPVFGALNEKGGMKLYAFLGGDSEKPTIRKRVIPMYDGELQDENEVLPKLREEGFELTTLYRAKK